MKFRAILATAAILLTSFSSLPAHGAPLTIGIAYDVGGRGDRSFNDAAALGLEKARKQFDFTLETVVTDGTSADRDRRVRALISKNCNPVIAIGPGYAATLQALAIEFPNTQFAILNDASIEALNVTSLIFSDTQGAYLAGFSAALASKTGKVAMIATANQADIYQDGFLAGVLASKRPIASIVRYTFGSPVTAAQQAMSAGADVIFVARPGSDSDIFAAIVARNKSLEKKKNFKPVGMIMVEPDQYVTVTSSTKKYLYASVVKHLDKAIFDLISKALAGQQHLDVLDPIAGIYGHRYTVIDGGITFTTYLPLLTAATPTINKAALSAAKISG